MTDLYEMKTVDKEGEARVVYGWTTANVIDRYWEAYAEGYTVVIRKLSPREVQLISLSAAREYTRIEPERVTEAWY